jgi:hypothetical protein
MKTAFTLAGFVAVFASQLPNADAIRDRLDRYLFDYEQQLSTVVAEERMSQRDGQRLETNAPGVKNSGPKTTSRSIVSEVAFIGLPGHAGWLGFRRVTTVNAKKLADPGPSLAQLLSDGAEDDYDQARLLLAQSAEHNLGFPRTTNLPNLPLEFLHPRNRHRLHHRLDGVEKIGGLNAARMVFEERSTPTIIQRPDGGDMRSLITAWIEPDSGRLLRAEVKTRDIRIGVLQHDNRVRVEFRPDAKLKMLVPYEMKEEFFAGRFREGTGTARYTNYRQFRTAARVVPQ